MSEVAVENPPSGLDSSPSRRDHEQHWVEKSIEDIADDYFSSVNPFAKKIVLEKKKCQHEHSDWDRLSQPEKDSVLNDWFIDASIKLRYEMKLGITDPKPPASDIFPRQIVHGGSKTVQYRDDQDGSNNNTGKILTWKDEFSGPFAWETKCQQELSVFSGESSTAGTPGHESTTSESLIQPLDSSQVNEDSALFPSPKGEDQQANSVMVMKDVTKRHSFGSNLLASLEERLAFDKAVSDTLDGKEKDDQDSMYQHIGQVDTKYVHAGDKTDNSSGASTPQQARDKSSEHNYKSPNREKFKPSKPKIPPPGPGPKPRDIPKYTDPPRYHKSQPQAPQYNEQPVYKIEQMEPPTQSIDRGRPTVEPPKQPKASRPKVEPPKPKTESTRPKIQPPKQPGNIPRPSMDPPPEPEKQRGGKSSGGLPSPRRQAAAKEAEKEKLLPQSEAGDASREGIPTSTSHDNISLEVKEENSKEPVSGDQIAGAGGAAGTGGFDFLMEW